MEKVFGLNALVDEIIISAEEGVAKPDHEFYEIALKRLNSKAENCIFVDDLIENVNAAIALGMNAILHIENETTIASLNAMIKAER
jgi:putative hydrolase of the HAD superfamily